MTPAVERPDEFAAKHGRRMRVESRFLSFGKKSTLPPNKMAPMSPYYRSLRDRIGHDLILYPAAGAVILVLMGLQLVRRADAAALASTSGVLARESGWTAFSAGLMVIAGNPKAILFYMGVLPGFFDFRRLTPLDMALICAVSVAVPFLGNLAWAALFARARRWLADPVAMKWTHVAAGLALVAVGLAIALA